MWHDFIEARELLLVVSLELESRDAGAADGAELCIAQRGAHVSDIATAIAIVVMRD